MPAMVLCLRAPRYDTMVRRGTVCGTAGSYGATPMVLRLLAACGTEIGYAATGTYDTEIGYAATGAYDSDGGRSRTLWGKPHTVLCDVRYRPSLCRYATASPMTPRTRYAKSGMDVLRDV
eukprot:2571058-Rhodomonas_salina.1